MSVFDFSDWRIKRTYAAIEEVESLLKQVYELLQYEHANITLSLEIEDIEAFWKRNKVPVSFGLHLTFGWKKWVDRREM